MMKIVWFLLLTLSLFKTGNASQARLAEWDGEYRNGDTVRRMLKLFSRRKDIVAESVDAEESSFETEERVEEMDSMDKQQGVRIEAAAYIGRKKKPASLGECTAGEHKYHGGEEYTPFYRVSYNYFHQSGRFSSRKYSDVMGGVGISAFKLFGASVKARVTSSVRRDRRSLLIYSHFVIHKGMISLVNPQVGQNWKDCTKQAKHFYLRDILTGLDDYLMVQLRFSSEAKRKEIEVKIKVKVLFFSITKTIRRVKTSLKTDFSLTIYRIKTFPYQKEEKYHYSGLDVEAGIKLVEEYEKSRSQLSRDIKAAKYDDLGLHLEYFFVPCLIKTVTKTLPFTRVNGLILAALIERTNELKSVLEDIESIKGDLKGELRSNVEEFEKDIKFRLNLIRRWKDENEVTDNYVIKLLELYGKERAPYFYERQFRKIVGNVFVP